jgi:hypothetical protein
MQERLSAAEEEVNKLRLEVKNARATIAAAQREAEDSKSQAARALSDLAASEAACAESDGALGAARAAEATATRAARAYEEQLRDLRR